MRRETCGVCESSDLQVFLDLGSSPLADAFPTDPATPEKTYPLQVAVCPRCSLVQLMEIVPDEELFGGDYGFFSSASPSLIAYHEAYARELIAGLTHHTRSKPVIEIASNDGDLLRHFQAAGLAAYGIDPAPVPSAAARARGLDITTAPFTLASAKELTERIGKAGLVIANNVMAHVSDLDDFFAGLRELLAFDGTAHIQVQYLPDLLTGNQFDHVYHEHRYFFGLRPVTLVAARHGLAVKHVERTAAQGGSIRMVIGGGVGYANEAGAGPTTTRMLASEDWLYGTEAFGGVQGRVEYIRARLNDLLSAERDAGRRVAGYAASAKSTTLLNYCGIGPRQLDYVVDTTPGKIGRFTPGTHIPIISPEQEAERGRADTLLVGAHNYLGGIVRRERHFLEGGGRFIVPIPLPVVL